MADLPEQTEAEREAVMARWWDRMSQQKRDRWTALGCVYLIGLALDEMPRPQEETREGD